MVKYVWRSFSCCSFLTMFGHVTLFRARNSKVQQGMEEGEHGEAGEDFAALDKDYEEYSQPRLGCLTGPARVPN